MTASRAELVELLRECEQLITERLHGPGVDDLLARVRAQLPRYRVEQGVSTWWVVDTADGDRVVRETHHMIEAAVYADQLNHGAPA